MNQNQPNNNDGIINIHNGHINNRTVPENNYNAQ